MSFFTFFSNLWCTKLRKTAQKALGKARNSGAEGESLYLGKGFYFTGGSFQHYQHWGEGDATGIVVLLFSGLPLDLRSLAARFTSTTVSVR